MSQHRWVPRAWMAGAAALLICSTGSPSGWSADIQEPSEEWTRHLEKLQKRVPKGFTVVEQPPFVVIGDESPDRVRHRASRTVRWAVEELKESYFEKDPEEIYDIWLFRDGESYRKHAKEFWGETPETPYGYASAQHHVLVMNIGTGGGTLIHEIVHPYIAANFAQAPSWFNEGLASLYEQCGERDGRIVGYTNWRLAGLQEAIRADEVPSFKTLMSTNTHAFYNKDPGTNYAQARYLMYYLQEKGLLRKYYRAYRDGYEADPTGYETLQKVLGREDMSAFQAEWEKWTLELSFP